MQRGAAGNGASSGASPASTFLRDSRFLENTHSRTTITGGNMRRTIVAGVVVSCVLVFGVGAVQMVPPTQDKPAQQVEVVNFPAVQQVGGSVQVSNLPLDGDGSVRVTAPSVTVPQIHFVGFTSPLPLGAAWLVGSRQCAAEFPGSRACTVEDFYKSTTVAPPFPVQAQGTGWVRMISRHPDTIETTAIDFPFVICLRSDGELDNSGCYNTSGVTDTPFACCGF